MEQGIHRKDIEHKSQGIRLLVNELSQDMVFGFGLKTIAKLPVMLFQGGFSASLYLGCFSSMTARVVSPQPVGFWRQWSVFPCG